MVKSEKLYPQWFSNNGAKYPIKLKLSSLARKRERERIQVKINKFSVFWYRNRKELKRTILNIELDN